MASVWAGTLALTTGTATLNGQGDQPVTNPNGPHATANNLTGTSQIAVTLVGGVAKTWTHNFNARPLALDVFTPAGVLVPNSAVAVVCNLNSIVLTAVASCNVNVFIRWWESPEWLNTARTPNFV